MLYLFIVIIYNIDCVRANKSIENKVVIKTTQEKTQYFVYKAM